MYVWIVVWYGMYHIDYVQLLTITLSVFSHMIMCTLHYEVTY